MVSEIYVAFIGICFHHSTDHDGGFLPWYVGSGSHQLCFPYLEFCMDNTTCRRIIRGASDSDYRNIQMVASGQYQGRTLQGEQSLLL